MGLMSCPETTPRNYHSAPRRIRKRSRLPFTPRPKPEIARGNSSCGFVFRCAVRTGICRPHCDAACPEYADSWHDELYCQWCVLMTLFSPTCFGRYCDHLQGEIITRIQWYNVINKMSDKLQSNTTLLILLLNTLQRHVSALRSHLQAEHNSQCRKIYAISFALSY